MSHNMMTPVFGLLMTPGGLAGGKSGVLVTGKRDLSYKVLA